jgi:diguanylate cyclase (GGDEF)-like protein
MAERDALPEEGTEQTLADLDQSHADADQTAADAEQAAADADSGTALADQVGADADQRAADRDQAAADRDIAAADPAPGRRLAYDASRSERAETAAGRRATTLERATGELARARQAMLRDEVAARRDLSALGRDRVAEVRDRAAAERDAVVRGGADEALKGVLAVAAAGRERAAEDRARATEDRQRAALDRLQAAADRRRARIALHQAQLDGLTGAFTRDLGRVTLQHEIDRSRRTGRPFVLAYIDVDGLKAVNDRDGHGAGDARLHQLVAVLEEHMRSYDPIVRFGGDEFICGFSGTEGAAAARRVHDIRAAVGAGDPPVAISVGLAELEEADTLDALIARADAAMYEDRRRRRAGR